MGENPTQGSSSDRRLATQGARRRGRPAPGPDRPPFASSTLTTFGATVGVAVFSLANVLVISRALGPAGRGDVVFLMTVASITAVLASVSVQEAIGNIAGAEPMSRPALAANSLVLAALAGAAGGGVVYALMHAFPSLAGDVRPALIWLALASVPILILQIHLTLLVRADYQFTLANAVTALPAIANVGINGTLAALGVITVFTAIGTWVVTQTVATAVLVWFVARRLAGFGKPDRRLALRSMGFGLKSYPSSVMHVANFRLDQWFVGAIAGSRELGLYSVAVAWFETLFFLPTAVAHVLRPDLVRGSASQAARQASSAFRVAVLATVPLAVGLVIVAPFLCVTVFGEEFRGAIDDLRLLAPGAFGIIAVKIFGGTLTAQGRPLQASAGLAAAFGATVLFDILLIPPFGGLGAALASTIAYSAGGVVVGAIFLSSMRGRLIDLVPRRDEAVLACRQVASVLRRWLTRSRPSRRNTT